MCSIMATNEQLLLASANKRICGILSLLQTACVDRQNNTMHLIFDISTAVKIKHVLML